MLKRGTVSLLVLGVIWAADPAYADDRSQIYQVPDDVKCQSTVKELFSDEEVAPVSKKITYCTDVEGNPLNGQMIKYYNGIALKRYPMKDGYLHGVGKIYYKNGQLKTALNYKKGVLDGFVLEFDNERTGNINGNLVEKVPYVNGQKEGIATYYGQDNITKVIYQKDKMHGAAKMWDKETKIKIYDLGFADDKLISATYYYDAKGECEQDCRNEYCTPQCDANSLFKCVQKCQDLEGQTKEVKVPSLLLSGINYQCLSFQEKLSTDKIPVKYSPNSECNQMWLVKNEQKLFNYLGHEPKSGRLTNKIEKINEERPAANDAKKTAASLSVQELAENPKPIQETAAQPESTKAEPVQNNKEEASSQTGDCEDLGLPGTYTVKESYQTDKKDRVCVVIKDNAENLLQYSENKEILRVWAPRKVCSKAEKILNSETCDANTLLYKFRMGEREIKPKKYSYGILAGIYSYINQDNKTENRKIPPLIIEGINQKCLVLQSILSYSTCPVIATGSSKDCNQMWRQQHREEIIGYIKECRAGNNKKYP